MQLSLHHLIFALALMLPIIVALVVMIAPTRRKDISGVQVGNPLRDAPVAPREEEDVEPLVHLCRRLGGQEMEGYILGLRHLPVEQAAPLLERHVRCPDPALQLYSQAVLQEGRDRLLQRFHRLACLPAKDPRSSAWLLETGLQLASQSLNSISERQGWLERLVNLARERLTVAPATPALLATTVRIFNEASLPHEGEPLLRALPAGSALREELDRQTQHLLHQRRLAA